ncbi:hypothetical protein REPUB_Repub02eG0108500 [Reevesia pubescens]
MHGIDNQDIRGCSKDAPVGRLEQINFAQGKKLKGRPKKTWLEVIKNDMKLLGLEERMMVPEISFGHHVRIALDIGCGVASFGAFLLQRNVTTLFIAPKDIHENQIQFALECGVPTMVAVFATRLLLYPSQAFDLIHCSRCRTNWTRDVTLFFLLHIQY